MPRTIDGFTVVSFLFSKESSSPHDLFIKQHSVRLYDESKPSGRTLFVINIPPYVSQDYLTNLFSCCGKVSSVLLQDSSLSLDKAKRNFQTGYVVFSKREALMKALSLEEIGPIDSDEVIGLTECIREYNSSINNHEKLNKEVTNFIKKNDKKEQQEKEPEVDDEGWTVVTKKGRNPGISRKESVENKIINKNKLKSRKKELKNFYTFQLKEQKMQHIIALRKSFQESKEKVDLMKKMRNFKPH